MLLSFFLATTRRSNNLIIAIIAFNYRVFTFKWIAYRSKRILWCKLIFFRQGQINFLLVFLRPGIRSVFIISCNYTCSLFVSELFLNRNVTKSGPICPSLHPVECFRLAGATGPGCCCMLDLVLRNHLFPRRKIFFRLPSVKVTKNINLNKIFTFGDSPHT